MDDKEFYKIIKEKRREIDKLNINKEEKQRLYQLADETVQRYEENKITYLKNQENLMQLNKSLDQLSKGFEKIESLRQTIRTSLSELEKIALQLRIRKSGEGQTPVNN